MQACSGSAATPCRGSANDRRSCWRPRDPSCCWDDRCVTTPDDLFTDLDDAFEHLTSSGDDDVAQRRAGALFEYRKSSASVEAVRTGLRFSAAPYGKIAEGILVVRGRMTHAALKRHSSSPGNSPTRVATSPGWTRRHAAHGPCQAQKRDDRRRCRQPPCRVSSSADLGHRPAVLPGTRAIGALRAADPARTVHPSCRVDMLSVVAPVRGRAPSSVC